MLSLLYLVASVHLIALISPGPDNFFVMQIAASNPRKHALYGVLGIIVGCLVWCILTLLGLKTVLQTYPYLAILIHFLAAIYFCWLGYKLITIKTDDEHELVALKPQTKIKLFILGLLTNISNLKAIIYFTSIFSMFTTNLTLTNMLLITSTVIVVSLGWFTCVACFFSIPKIQGLYLQHNKLINNFTGIIFLFFAMVLLYLGINLWL